MADRTRLGLGVLAGGRVFGLCAIATAMMLGAAPAFATPQPAAAGAVAGRLFADDVAHVIGAAGTTVDTRKAYLATRYSGSDLSAGQPAWPPPAMRPTAPDGVIVDPAGKPEPPGKRATPRPEAPPNPIPQVEATPPAALVQATESAPTGGDGLGGIVSEVRLGAMAHDVGVVGTNKEDGVDINAELLFVSPDFLDVIFSPRPHIGITVNTEGDTSQLYGGLAWGWTFWGPLFVEATLALAVHDGELDIESRDTKALGCRVLFRESVSLGARFLERHSISVMFAHISNAGICHNNEGLDTLGLRYSFRF